MSQKQKILKILREQGEVTRNTALKMSITRLSAIIKDLKKEGMNIEGHWDITEQGKDYKYVLLDKPKKVEVFSMGGEVIHRKVTW